MKSKVNSNNPMNWFDWYWLKISYLIIWNYLMVNRINLMLLSTIRRNWMQFRFQSLFSKSTDNMNTLKSESEFVKEELHVGCLVIRFSNFGKVFVFRTEDFLHFFSTVVTHGCFQWVLLSFYEFIFKDVLELDFATSGVPFKLNI